MIQVVFKHINWWGDALANSLAKQGAPRNSLFVGYWFFGGFVVFFPSFFKYNAFILSFAACPFLLNKYFVTDKKKIGGCGSGRDELEIDVSTLA